MARVKDVCTGYQFELNFENVPNPNMHPLGASFTPFGYYDEIVKTERNGTNPYYKFDVTSSMARNKRYYCPLRIGYIISGQSTPSYFGVTDAFNWDYLNKDGEYKLQMYEEFDNPFISLVRKRKQLDNCICTLKIKRIIEKKYE